MACVPGARAEVLGQPTGPAVLTVVGGIGKTNRGPYDEEEDVFFKFHERRFDNAAAFDLGMLEALPLHEISVVYDRWPRPVRLDGPWLTDVLAAAGAAGKDVSVLALDGFTADITASDLAAYDWLVALKRDGRYLNLGQRGPLWIVYARRDGKTITADDEERWPWGVFLIEVH